MRLFGNRPFVKRVFPRPTAKKKKKKKKKKKQKKKKKKSRLVPFAANPGPGTSS